MQFQGAFVFLSALAITTASPVHRRCDSGHIPGPANGVTYVLPSTGGPTPLPAPDTPLKHIVVGHGVQNYTCTAPGEKGAQAPGALSSSKWNNLTSKVLRTTSQPISTDPSSPFPAPADLSVSGVYKPIPFIGHHYFDANGVPTFSLHDNAELLKAQKILGIPAPSTADKGLTNEGAVDWLYLSDKGGSVGLTKVYRVLTSGGSPSVCGAAGEKQSVPYTTTYWFY
ncbi:hypothetical protein NUW58_g5479 [Xylaria curta]|uniref:Uncharacterized protein n=1 Tax=Xylaria curta TaxID=42375 RepID=A0ACC1P4D2_9PEZI|nr:hypothetical protein NUW58_g5479 [Xylaria curta]